MSNQIISCFNNGKYMYGSIIELIAKTNNDNGPDYYKPYGSDPNKVFSLNKKNNTIQITGIGIARLTVVFGEKNGYKMAHKTIEIEGIKSRPKINVSVEKRSLSLGLSSKLSYNVINLNTNKKMDVPVRMEFQGSSVEFNVAEQKLVAKRYGSTSIIFSTEETIYCEKAENVAIKYLVDDAFNNENKMTFKPKLDGESLRNSEDAENVDDKTFMEMMLDNGALEKKTKEDITRLIGMGGIKNTKKNQFGVPLVKNTNIRKRQEELCNNITRTEMTRAGDSKFNIFVEDITTPELDYISVSLTDIKDLDGMGFDDEVVETLKNLNNTTDIIKIDGYKFDIYSDSFEKKHKYIPLKIYHPHDTLTLYHVDDEGQMKEVTKESYPESYMVRDLVNPNYWYINAMFSYLVGATNSGSSSGDPHITPIFGPTYELPNKVANYRFLQGDDMLMNVSTRKISGNEKEIIKKFYDVAGGDAPGRLVMNGVFINKVYLSSGKNVLIYDFDSKKLQKTSGDYFKITYVDDVKNEYYEMCKKVKSICVEFNHELYGRVKVALKHFSNPQVMYGVSTVIENQGSKCSGLLVREYKANTMELSNIMLKHYIRGVIPRTKGQCQNVFMRGKKAN